MAMYVALVQKMNVVVVRRVDEATQKNCLFFLGHKGDRVFYVSKQNCKLRDAVVIYRTLKTHQDFSSVWLMLDGFVYSQIPDGLKTFHLLAASEQVYLEPGAYKHAYCCLVPGWRRDDLFELGRSIYQRQDEEMAERAYYSGGSVRVFTLDSIEEIVDMMDAIVHSRRADTPLSDDLLCTFIKRDRVESSYRSGLSWGQIPDSEYVLLRLQGHFGRDYVADLHDWTSARGAAYASLARTLLELRLHGYRHERDTALTLQAAPYYTLVTTDPNGDQSAFASLGVTRGLSRCSASSEAGWVAWVTGRSNTDYGYDHNQPPIVSIVKLATGEFAYLYMTIATHHCGLDAAELTNLNEMVLLGSGKPTYIVVCPTRAAVEALAVGSQDAMVKLMTVCDLYLAYYQRD